MSDDKYNGTYPKAWSAREVSLYQSLGREPAKSSNGLWVNDLEREARELKTWSLAELFALAQNELYSKHQPGTGEFYQALRSKAIVEDIDATKWSEEELYDWLVFERTPEKSPGGYFLNDPERWVKDAANWDDSELQDLGAGYFGEPSRNQLYILDEACERFNLPLGITWEDYCLYIQMGVKPALTANGVLINSRTRSVDRVSTWSEAEVEAWLTNEIIVDDEAAIEKLRQRCIDMYSLGYYWTVEMIKDYVIHDVFPEIDYSQYSDEQLQVLAEKDRDDEAVEELECRKPVPEPEPDIVEEDPEPVITEDEVNEEVTVEESPLPEPPVDDTPDPEPVLPEIHWTDLVPEGAPLYCAMVAPTETDLIENSLHRSLLSASKWSLTELVAWARDEVTTGMNTTERTLVTALRTHCGEFANNWTDGAVKTFIAHQELPEGFEDGLLAEDQLRDRKHPGDWSDLELKAWGQGFIRTPVDPEQILLSARVRFKLPGKLTDAEVRSFLVTGTVPDKKIPVLGVGEIASSEQLEAWLKGHLSVDETEHPRLFNQVRLAYGIDPRWTDDHILSYIRNDKLPTELEDGTLVDNRLRDKNSWEQWTWKELRALALGQIEAHFELVEALEHIRGLIYVQFGVNCNHWADDEVIAYLSSDVKPKVLEDGVYLNDPTRPTKTPVEWRKAELKAWLRGDIKATELASAEALWNEVYVRFEVPMFWYFEDARSYVLHGTVVPSTPSGLYIRDRHRDARPARHWTRREIKAWCRGLILPGIQAPEGDLIRQACLLFGVSNQLDNPSIKRRIADITEESMTMTIKFVIDDLESYVKGRKDAGADGRAAAPYQSLLDRCINRVLRLEGEDFVQGWTELLKFFYQHSKGICSPKQIYVGVGSMVITPKGLRQFQNMTSILMSTCDPATRDKSVKLIEWTTALKEVINEGSRQSLLSYYGK